MQLWVIFASQHGMPTTVGLETKAKGRGTDAERGEQRASPGRLGMWSTMCSKLGKRACHGNAAKSGAACRAAGRRSGGAGAISQAMMQSDWEAKAQVERECDAMRAAGNTLANALAESGFNPR